LLTSAYNTTFTLFLINKKRRQCKTRWKVLWERTTPRESY